ncbi:leptin a [Lepisosteus oculatus]|uniref:Leptin n=1 Tax=Lepisosteus oculatus TaxID=7918 RepID=W5NES0_LEPOC|nr:PREDICTED: leptin-like [Lepisosteus oculatus]
MKYPVIPFCLSSWMFLTLSYSRPLAEDRVKNDARLLAQTTVIRIQKHTNESKMSPNLVFSGLELIPDALNDKTLEGLSTVEDNLHTFQEILSSLPMEEMDQILADIFNLRMIIKSLATSVNCAPLKSSNMSHLESFLKTNAAFHVTIGNVALERLQKYLLKLIRNLDQLKNC